MHNIHPTKGIVLRCVKYGDTSIICSVFTELFGLQSYLIQGVRKQTKKGMGKGNLFQPPSILALDVYHHPMKSLQRIRESRWAHVYQSIFQDITKNAVALFMVELLQKSLQEPEPQRDLFAFVEDVLLHLDRGSKKETANLGLWFALHLTGFFGFRMEDVFGSERPVLDLQAGSFVAEAPMHAQYAGGRLACLTAEMLRVQQPADLEDIDMQQTERRQLLQLYEQFYALHVPGFGKLKTVPVLQTIFS
jgi:DNA repair protein RecO (recombination protein O)